jgi:hypothetical protein
MSEKRLRIMTEKRNANKEWVALFTFENDAGIFYEEGGVYSHEPQPKGMTGARVLAVGEHEASCSRCGQRFAATDEGTAEEHRDLHFNGDDEIPSICASKNATHG